jgi:ribosomal protein L37AE/L43A
MDQYVKQGREVRRSRLHCPHCRSEQLIAVSEATRSGGVASTSRITRNVGLTTYSTNTINRHYWMCRECGHKFRNLEDLNKELVKETKNERISRNFAIVIGCVYLFLIIVMMTTGMVGLCLFAAVLCSPMAIIFLILWSTFKKKVENMTVDKAYLEQHCFD